MKRIGRTVVFALFLAVFLIGAPAIVLYTAGYRYNPKNGHIVRTGVLAVSSTPRGAVITLDGIVTNNTTPYVFSRVTPGNYTLTLTKEGYHSYDDTITIESGKTTYLSDVTLFAASEPIQRTAEKNASITPSVDGSRALVVRRSGGNVEVWEYNIDGNTYTLIANVQTDPDAVLHMQYQGENQTPVLVNETEGTTSTFFGNTVTTTSQYPDIQTIGNLRMVHNTNAVEIRKANTPELLLALLPIADYTVAQTEGDYAILTTEDERLYLLDLSSPDPILVSTHATTFDWKPQTSLLAWTDGVEINAYSTVTHARTFVTRQSEAILDLAISDDGQTIFSATSTAVQSFTVEGVARHIMTLAVMDAIEQVWTVNANATALYVVGSMNGIRGMYELALR